MKIKHTIASLILLTAGMTASAQTVGLNFCDQSQNPHIGTGTADGFSNWTDSWAVGNTADASLGSITLLGSSITANWNGSGIWAAGAEGNSEQALYRVFLDDGDAGNSLVSNDGIGVSVTISGLSAWLAANGGGSYQIRAYDSADNNAATFQPVTIRLGAPNSADGAAQLTNLGILDTFNRTVLGNGSYPTDGSGTPDGNVRGYGDSISTLTADVITLTIPVNGGNNLRGSLAGFMITTIAPVPEPSTLALAIMGGFGVLLMKRRFKKS